MKSRFLRSAAMLPAFLLLGAVAPEDEGGGGGGSPPPPPPSASDEPWYGKDVDADTKGWIEKNGFKGTGDIIKTAMHQEKMIGVPKEQLLRLPADRTPESMGEVFAQLGKPKDVAGYGIKEDAAIGLAGEPLDTFLKTALDDAHLTDWQAQRLIEKWYKPMVEKLGAAKAGATEETFKAGDKAIRDEFGDAYDDNVAAINALFKEHGNEELDEYLFESGRGNDVRFAKFMAKIVKLVAEPGALPGEKGRDTSHGGKLTPGEAQAKLIEFEKANGEALLSKSHPDHLTVVKMREDLIKAAHPAG